MMIEESRKFGDAEEICEIPPNQRVGNSRFYNNALGGRILLNSLSSVGENEVEHDQAVYNEGQKILIAINDSTVDED
jgi:hypothetical protein